MPNRVKVNGALLRELREDMGFSRGQLAELARVSEGMLRNLESEGDHTALPMVVEALSRILGVHPKELSGEYVPPAPTLLGNIPYDQAALKAALEDQGLTFADFAKLAGISAPTARSLVYREHASADVTTLYKAAHGLDISPEKLAPVLMGMIPSKGDREFLESAGRPYLDYPEVLETPEPSPDEEQRRAEDERFPKFS